jgi:transketolase
MKKNIENIDIMTAFFRELTSIGQKDKNIFFISADHGAWALADFKKKLKNQYMNIGISEQNMISFAAGMALNKKKVFLFTITPFITQRCLEQIKIDLCYPNLPVTIVGNGSSLTYAHHGTSHQAIEDVAMMRVLPNLKILNPCDNTSSRAAVKIAYESNQPVYIKLDKGFFPDIYKNFKQLKSGLCHFNNKEKKTDLCIFSTGNMIEQAKEIKKALEKENINTSFIDIFKIKPLNKKKIIKILQKTKAAITIEEQHIDGGIGSQICELIVDNQISTPLKRFGINDEYCVSYGDREWLRKYYKIDTNQIIKETFSWIKSKYKNAKK